MSTCQFCRPTTDLTTPLYHDGTRVRVYECDTCTKPLVVLADHRKTPSLETEAYALGVARGLFGPSAAFFEASHGMPADHWAAHVDVATG